jgi:hypothetical protein
LLALATSLSAVPSDINYQGRLTDANGDAVTGDVSMSVKMYDAQSGGNEIYSEDIGTVTLDENGVYSFQFGASGNSTVTKTETIVTSDGSSTEYTGTFTNTPIDGTISVTDETYSWNDIDGNPGEQATAYIIIINGFVIFADIENGGSGYDDDNPPLVTITGDGGGATATATLENGVVTGITITGPGIDYTEGDIIIAPPPAPFTVDKVDGNLEVGYGASPNFGIGVIATYKTLEPSIIGALSEASSHWLELTVNGTAQNPRERILSVPFAQVAGDIPKINAEFSLLKNRNENLEQRVDAVLELLINDIFHSSDSGIRDSYQRMYAIDFRSENYKARIGDHNLSGENSESWNSYYNTRSFDGPPHILPMMFTVSGYDSGDPWTVQFFNCKIHSYYLRSNSASRGVSSTLALQFNYDDGSTYTESIIATAGPDNSYHNNFIINPFPEKVVESVYRNGFNYGLYGGLRTSYEYFHTDQPSYFTVLFNDGMIGHKRYSMEISSESREYFDVEYEFLDQSNNVLLKTYESSADHEVLKEASSLRVTIHPLLSDSSFEVGTFLDGFILLAY